MAVRFVANRCRWVSFIIIIIVLFTLWFYFPSFKATPKFSIDYKNNIFLKDGQAFDYVSGSLHYFRVPHQLWYDRLLKLRASGINVVSTYVAWNVHEPHPGEFDFKNDADLVEFIKIAQSIGLYVNIRPGPYICSEWDLGGIPYFVLGSPKDNVYMRSSDKRYMEYVERYFSELLPRLQPYLYEFGGPIILVQVENEYGSYEACDHEYKSHLTGIMQFHLGHNVVFYTADGWDMNHLICGPVHNMDVLTTVNFGPNSDHMAAFSRLRSFQGHGPLVNSEYYPGWLDHWGESHQCKTTDLVITEFNNMLSSHMGRIFVNFYMFFGGTNFGFYNGANMALNSKYRPDPTSYDYDAPMTECGDLTEKYYAIRHKIKAHLPQLIDEHLLSQINNSTKKSYGQVPFNELISFTEIKQLATKEFLSVPLYTFEELQQDFGFVLYETSYKSDTVSELIVSQPRDMIYVFTDNVYAGKIYRNSAEKMLQLPPFNRLSLLVENMGRINYGPYLHDYKGILGEVKVGKTVLSKSSQWDIWTLPLNNTATAHFNAISEHPGPGSFLRGEFTVRGPPADTWVKMDAFSKGVIFVNDKNIGRYWPNVGPQKHLYIPSVWLTEGINHLVLFEVDQMPKELYVELVDYPDVGSC